MKISAMLRLALLGLLLILFGASGSLASDMSKLIDRDCRNCHSRVIKKLNAVGSPHATEVGCKDCHTYHPQRHEEPKVDCAGCHAPGDSAHYQHGNCQQCHHAHWPLEIDFSRITLPVKKNCLTCHGDKFTAGPSKHTEQMRCTECHSSHKTIPSCRDCHEGHGGDKRLSDCLKCHPAHNPLPPTFEDGLDASLCASCHAETTAAMAKSKSMHARQSCTDCHSYHGEKPNCLNCHEPHSKVMGAADCKSCHNHHEPLPLKLKKGISFELCSSCHEETAAVFTEQGAAHKANLSCSDCHLEHPPSKNAIPKCSMCHDKADNPHFGVKSCSQCHNPHRPQAGAFSELENIRPACVSCHSQVDAEMAAGSGKHAEQDCNACHSRHGELPSCLDCHEGHNEKMAAADCSGCHKPHRPLPPQFKSDTASALCADCHADVAATFAASGGRHQQSLDCAGCHEEHPPGKNAIPGCDKCHAPADNTHYAVVDCSRCHDPHQPQAKPFAGLENVRPACAGCHEDVLTEMAKVATAHSETLDCNQCHEQHGAIPSCLDCHQGHDEEMQLTGCIQCHHPHRPLPVEFREGTAAVLCSACHPQPVADLTTAGGAHKEQLGCVECHAAHPPAENVIPACASCHASSDNAHFSLDGCVDCHNPHRPILEDISGLTDSRPICAGCHAAADKQLSEQISAHSSQACVDCHQQHGDAPSCLDCHEGHHEAMMQADCLSCHQPHAPLQIAMSEKSAAQLCSACHSKQVAAISEAGASHRDKLSCAGCHQVHPAAACTQCHAEHPQQGAGIPESCFICHAPSSHPHYAVGSCQDCHQPHQPLALDLSKREPLGPVCVSCHQQVAEQFAAMPGGHSQQDCANCHSQHTKLRKCVDCHQPHEKSMSQGDCLHCHSPHQPQDVRFRQAGDIPIKHCTPCHEEQTAALAAKGRGHQESFTSCTACHPEHLPNGKATKLDCGTCHLRVQRRHFTLDNCSGCHNPHQPLVLDLTKLTELRPACVSCHNNQERLYKLHPSKHSAFDCGKCHAGPHGSKMECLECHEAHIPGMTHLQCLKCHPPHFPQLIKDKPGQAGKVCASCHAEAAAKIKEQGAAHGKQPCVSCHQSHPPAQEKVIPACSICHGQKDHPHFAVGNCQDCHQGHQPLGHDLAKVEDANPACEACHAAVKATFAATPSAHAEQSCTLCHPRHGEAQKCSDCHEPHTQEMAGGDCQTCHAAAHAPHQVAFVGQLPSGFCQSCHEEQVSALAATEAKHGELSCVDCHKGAHGNAPSCASCHEPPHDPALHRKFPDCLKCHLNPHDLADWRSEEQPPTPVAPESIRIRTETQPAASEAASNEDVK